MTKLYTRSLEPATWLWYEVNRKTNYLEEYASFHSNFSSFYLIYLSAFYSTPAEAAAVLTLKRTKSLSNSQLSVDSIYLILWGFKPKNLLFIGQLLSNEWEY